MVFHNALVLFNWIFKSTAVWFSIVCEKILGFNVWLKLSDIIFIIFMDNVIISRACSLRFFLVFISLYFHSDDRF